MTHPARLSRALEGLDFWLREAGRARVNRDTHWHDESMRLARKWHEVVLDLGGSVPPHVTAEFVEWRLTR